MKYIKYYFTLKLAIASISIVSIYCKNNEHPPIKKQELANLKNSPREIAEGKIDTILGRINLLFLYTLKNETLKIPFANWKESKIKSKKITIQVLLPDINIENSGGESLESKLVDWYFKSTSYDFDFLKLKIDSLHVIKGYNCPLEFKVKEMPMLEAKDVHAKTIKFYKIAKNYKIIKSNLFYPKNGDKISKISYIYSYEVPYKDDWSIFVPNFTMNRYCQDIFIQSKEYCCEFNISSSCKINSKDVDHFINSFRYSALK